MFLLNCRTPFILWLFNVFGKHHDFLKILYTCTCIIIFLDLFLHVFLDTRIINSILYSLFNTNQLIYQFNLSLTKNVLLFVFSNSIKLLQVISCIYPYNYYEEQNKAIESVIIKNLIKS